MCGFNLQAIDSRGISYTRLKNAPPADCGIVSFSPIADCGRRETPCISCHPRIPPTAVLRHQPGKGGAGPRDPPDRSVTAAGTAVSVSDTAPDTRKSRRAAAQVLCLRFTGSPMLPPRAAIRAGRPVRLCLWWACSLTQVFPSLPGSQSGRSGSRCLGAGQFSCRGVCSCPPGRWAGTDQLVIASSAAGACAPGRWAGPDRPEDRLPAAGGRAGRRRAAISAQELPSRRLGVFQQTPQGIKQRPISGTPG